MVSNNLAPRKEALEKDLAELIDVKHMVEGELFQKFFATPFHLADKKLKTAYECKDMDELKVIQGKHEGFKKLFDIVEEVDNRLKFIRHDLSKF